MGDACGKALSGVHHSSVLSDLGNEIVFSFLICVCVSICMYMYMQGYMHVYGGQRSASDVFLNCFPPFSDSSSH